VSTQNEIDPDLDRRLARLRELAEPTGADKHRLLFALRTSIHASAGTPSAPVPPERAADVSRNGQPWATWARPLVPWLGGVFIGASITLAIGFGRDPVPGVREAGSTASGAAAAVAAANENGNTIGAVRVAERVDVAASEEPASSVDGTVGPLGVARTRPTPGRSERAAPDRSPPPAASTQLDLSEALEQLHSAERALYASDAELALGILSDLDRRAGPALLREERLTTLVLALCQGGRIEEALDARLQLEQEFAGSIYVRRLDQSCAVKRERR
jgi:hypothetical protein